MRNQNNPTKFVIESGIPMPCQQHGRPMKYPLGLLDHNQSFFVAETETPSRNALPACITSFERRHAGFKFVIERAEHCNCDKINVPGYRVWRK